LIVTALSDHFSAILQAVGDAKRGLTKPIFLFVSQLTPMVNVDLLIKNAHGQTLLTWREDEFYGPGWHVPGGVIRFKELVETRIKEVAKSELEAEVISEPHPICVREAMAQNRDVRGHFISMLYRCELKTDLLSEHAYTPNQAKQNGHWQWHDGCPVNIIKQHEIYREFI
jgi:ADP-ribose pyrophosphatase YjhB (NUDIX family)